MDLKFASEIDTILSQVIKRKWNYQHSSFDLTPQIVFLKDFLHFLGNNIKMNGKLNNIHNIF